MKKITTVSVDQLDNRYLRCKCGNADPLKFILNGHLVFIICTKCNIQRPENTTLKLSIENNFREVYSPDSPWAYWALAVQDIELEADNHKKGIRRKFIGLEYSTKDNGSTICMDNAFLVEEEIYATTR